MVTHIVIIGGGFAGINLAKQLRNVSGIRVTLVDKNNYNFFPPLIYQVATGFIEPSNISYPFRKLFHKYRNIRFRMGELQRIRAEENTVVLNNGTLQYDYLVLATGTKSNYFGMENIRKNALPMKTIDDAIVLRNSLLQSIEAATIEKDEARKRRLTTVVIAGGGPTGVEVAGMLAEMRSSIIEKDYPELAGIKTRIVLIDGAPVLLTPMSGPAQQYTLDTLLNLGVEVLLNKQVKDYSDQVVELADGTRIETNLLFWTAGVTADTFEGIPKESYGRSRRLLVDAFNKVQGFDNIYALGDTCIMEGDIKFPDGHPQLAQPAMQQGENLGRNFRALLRGGKLKPFRYFDKGSMAIIGRSKAVADLPRPEKTFKGWIAWMMWLFVHLFSLINYRNRLKTMFNWTLSYFTRDQSLRMIIRPDGHEASADTPPEAAKPGDRNEQEPHKHSGHHQNPGDGEHPDHRKSTDDQQKPGDRENSDSL